jgi:hypothetical protein
MGSSIETLQNDLPVIESFARQIVVYLQNKPKQQS